MMIVDTASAPPTVTASTGALSRANPNPDSDCSTALTKIRPKKSAEEEPAVEVHQVRRPAALRRAG